MRSDGCRVAWHDAACDQAFCNGYDLGLEFDRAEGRPLPASFLYSIRESFGAPYTLLENRKTFLSASIDCSKGRVYSLYMTLFSSMHELQICIIVEPIILLGIRHTPSASSPVSPIWFQRDRHCPNFSSRIGITVIRTLEPQCRQTSAQWSEEPSTCQRYARL